MKTPYLSFAALAALLVAGCGGNKSPAENNADQLDNAAAQSSDFILVRLAGIHLPTNLPSSY